VRSLILGTNGRLLIVGGGKGTIRVWDGLP
jgi:hypothetical protein